MTLYPIWQANKYKITLRYQDGNGTKKTIYATYNDTYKALQNISRVGYTFRGWSTSSSKMMPVKTTDIVKITNDTTFYAMWKINTYTVKFNPNGGKVNGSKANFSKKYVYNKAAKTKFSGNKIPIPKRKGYVFNGWKYKNRGNSYDLVNNSKITSNLIVKASWTKASDVKVVFNKTKFKKVSTDRYDVVVSWGGYGAEYYEYRLGTSALKAKNSRVRTTKGNQLTLRRLGKTVYGVIQVRESAVTLSSLQ